MSEGLAGLDVSLALEPQPMLHVTPLGTVNGLAAEVNIDSLVMRWQVLVLQNGEGRNVYLAHSTPDGWSGLLRQADHTERGYPPPTTNAELIRYCRWLFRLRVEGGG